MTEFTPNFMTQWLFSNDWTTTQLVDWFQGYDLPALGHDEEPYFWLLRSIPEGSNRYQTEKAVAVRIAVLLKEQPDLKLPGKRPNQVLYNALMMSAGLSCPDELAEPLSEMLERKELHGNWRGV